MFEDLARLETLAPNSREFQQLAQSLAATATVRERAGLKAGNNIEKYRARTLLYHLQRLQNLPAQRATEPDAILDWLPHEAWYATRALRPGMYRVLTAVSALDDTTTPDPTRAAWAARLFEEQRLIFDFDLAERLASGLYRRNPNAENVERLARVFVWRGNTAAAQNVLQEALGTTDDSDLAQTLHLARARVAAAAGDDRTALAEYGAALSLGSDDAALDLALLALRDGQRARALRLADLVLARDPERDDALAIRGMAQLPPPDETQHWATDNATLGPNPATETSAPPRRNPTPRND